MKLKIRCRPSQALIKSIKIIVLCIFLWLMIDIFYAVLISREIYARQGVLIAISISMITLCFMMYDEVCKR